MPSMTEGRGSPDTGAGTEGERNNEGGHWKERYGERVVEGGLMEGEGVLIRLQ